MMNLDAALRDLTHSDARVRAQAADALGRSEARDQAVPALERAAADEHPSVRYAALLSLGELEAAASWPLVVAALDDEEPLCREAAAIALGELGAPEAWEPLAGALGNAHAEVRFQTIASLAQIDAARAAPLLRPLLDDGDAKVRAQAAAALGDARDLSACDTLSHLLDDQPEVRTEAALALGRMGDPRALPRLLEALDQRDHALAAAETVAKWAARPEVRAAFEALLGRWLVDPLVKVRAAEGLAKSGVARGRQHLEKAARARRDDVRGLAQAVLKDLDAHGRADQVD